MTRTSWFTRVKERPRTGRMVAVFLLLCSVTAGGVLENQAGAAGACDALVIESIGVEQCVVEGGQREIDAGLVARVSDMSTPAVHWLAAHRTSHGGTFGRLTELRAGATVSYRGTDYHVVEYRLFDRTKPWLVDDLLLTSEPTVVLQTSAYGNFVHLWLATAPGALHELADAESTARTGPPTKISIVAPTRILDTRDAATPLVAWQPRLVRIDPATGVPATATVAFLNVTAIGEEAAGYLTTYACGEPVPETSSLNWSQPGDAVGNLVVVALAGRSFCGVVSSTADIVIDLVGYGDSSSLLGYDGARQARLLDTRTATLGAMRGVETRRIDVARQVGDAAGQAVEVSLTARSTRRGHITVHPCGADSGSTSALNPRPAVWTTNSVLVRLDDDGGFCVTSHFSGDDVVDLFVDLQGTFSERGARFQRLRPVRLVDTRRLGSSLAEFAGTGGPTNGRIALPGSSWRGLPANRGLVVNVTTVNAMAEGYVTAWPCATAKPFTSIQNPQVASATASAGSIGDGGSICVQSLSPVHMVIDVFGAWVWP